VSTLEDGGNLLPHLRFRVARSGRSRMSARVPRIRGMSHATGAYLRSILRRRDRWHRDSSSQKQPMLTGVRLATARVARPSAWKQPSPTAPLIAVVKGFAHCGVVVIMVLDSPEQVGARSPRRGARRRSKPSVVPMTLRHAAWWTPRNPTRRPWPRRGGVPI